ncbi:MAG TPA: site-2 protease family protein [Gaiellales bacterium]|nr:site-2 protease family protein [Gaiellales bacterium]
MSWDPSQLDSPPPAEMPPPPPPVQRPQHPLRRLFAPFAGAALLVWKLLGPLLIAVKNVKLLGASVTFLISLAAYTSIWGWHFAVGFMVLLFVHEMGHVIQLRREGVPASAPMFVPFMGAFVGMKELPRNAWMEAKVGLAGPVLGTAGALVCLGAAMATDSNLLRAVAYTGCFLNLINLIPVLPLDGGRAAAAFHPAFWFVGVFVVALLFFWHPNALILIIALLGGYELFHRWGHRNDPKWREYNAVTWGQRVAVGAVYLGLIAVLVAAMQASYLHRTF